MAENIINKIELKLGDMTVSLTIEQAKKLKEALGELFGKDVVKEVVTEHVHHNHWPYHWHWQPFYRTTAGPTAQYQQSTGTLSLKVE